MSSNLITADRTTTMKEIRFLMKENKISGVPIINRKRLVGIITIEDIMNALSEGYIDDPAENHMSKSMIVMEEEMPLSMAVEAFEKYSFNRFPVLNEKKQLIGIISNRDITNKLLMEMNKEIRKLEETLYTETEKDIESHQHRFPVIRHDFNHAGKASTEIKKMLKDTGLENSFIRRVSVAAYELEMNQAAHSLGGELTCKINPERIELIAKDKGPGIPDIEKAMQEGFSTATEWIRSLGFGAGMGLPNIKRVSDEFIINSDGSGTEIHTTFNINNPDKE
ncbi:MAG: CBS domain-containing protein [Spirochaetales bacterium]|nr:CBS domain-containing protein [Spirochaetales bacterium]